MRCFLAIDLPEDARAAVEHWIRARKRDLRDVRWSAPAQFHITLHFLGELEAAQREAVRVTLEEVARKTAPFLLRLGAVGVFPDSRAPRVVWIGVEDPAGCCAAFIRETTPAIRALGIRTDERPFTPHITLGRARGPAGVQSLARWFAGAATQRHGTVDQSAGAGPVHLMQSGIAPIEFLSREVNLYESRLAPAGAVHFVLHRWSFQGGSA